MAHMWDRGVKAYSTWHGLEEVVEMVDAISMIDHAERTGAWPVSLELVDLHTPSGVRAYQRAVQATYREHPDRVVGVVGNEYNFTAPERWRALMHAAYAAGAKPTGALSLRDGRTIIGTFQVNGLDSGIACNLLAVDTFDGSRKLMYGSTCIDVVCANTLKIALDRDGSGMSTASHCSTINDVAEGMAREIAVSLETGQSMRELVETARQTVLSGDEFESAFDALFPRPEKDASGRKETRMNNVRDEAREALKLPINLRELSPYNVSVLWNTATYLVDRELDGTSRERKGSNPLETMLFGTRGARVESIRETIETFLPVAA